MFSHKRDDNHDVPRFKATFSNTPSVHFLPLKISRGRLVNVMISRKTTVHPKLSHKDSNRPGGLRSTDHKQSKAE